MKNISIFITRDPDQDVMEDVEDEINSVLNNHFSNWDYTITVQDVSE